MPWDSYETNGLIEGWACEYIKVTYIHTFTSLFMFLSLDADIACIGLCEKHAGLSSEYCE